MITNATELPDHLITGNHQLWAFEVEVDQGRIVRIIAHWPEYLAELDNDQLGSIARLVATEMARRDDLPVAQPVDDGVDQ